MALGVGHRRQLQGCGHIDADAVATAASLGVTVEGCTDLIADVAGCDDSNYGDLIQGLCPGTCGLCVDGSGGACSHGQ